MTTTVDIVVSAIEAARIAEIRNTAQDERGNPLTPFAAEGWEPLRCCLTFPRPGDAIALIAYSPFATPSPWSETGPVYIHPAPCDGYRAGHELPDRMRTGPKILRTYRADGTLDYDHITSVETGADVDAPIRALLALDEVATVHVRATASQCFGYAVTRTSDQAIASACNRSERDWPDRRTISQVKPLDLAEPPPTLCWCCGCADDPRLMVHLGHHPEVALCRRCARWASAQAWAIDDRAARGPAVFVRNRLRALRRIIIARGLHRHRIVGPLLRWLGDRLP